MMGAMRIGALRRSEGFLTAIRADLRRPVEPLDRSERPFLAISAVLVVVVAWATDPGSAVEVAGVACAAAVLVVHAYRPLPPEIVAVLVIVPVSVAVARDGNLEVAFFLVTLVTLYSAWTLGSTVRAVAILVVAGVSPIVASLASPGGEGMMWSPWCAAAILTFVLGRTLRGQGHLIAELAAARQALADQAVADERRRIARELHDLSGHTIAAILLHVTGARHVLRRDVDEADAALVEVERLGRSSLDQIRVTVAALRSAEGDIDPPVPGSADVGPLVEEYRRAGLEIEASISPSASGIDGPVALAVHRIGREALANVARHAPSNVVDFRLDLDAGESAGSVRRLHLVVADHGRRAAPPDAGARHGLVGMRERARALGGHLSAGPTDDGWRLEASVPIREASDPVREAADP